MCGTINIMRNENLKLISKYSITAKDIAVIEDHLNYGYGYEYLENRFSFSELEVILDTWTI
jgi:hypothetical protein